MMGFKQGCLVELASASAQTSRHSSPGCGDKELINSASGILLADGWILTHGSLLLSYISKNGHQNEVRKKDYFSRGYFKDLTALVKLEPDQKSSSTISSHTTVFKETGYTNLTEPLQLVGNITCMWRAKGFCKVIQTFLPASEGWSFFEDPDKNSQSSEDELIRELLPFFVLIHFISHQKHENEIHICQERLMPGSTVHVIGTPFGCMTPEVFLNSVSEGIISNTVGSQQELIITDARCIPGTEGGPVYLGHARSSKYLLGVVVSALCWKNNEWIGLSLVCNIREVLHSLIENVHPDMTDIAKLKNIRLSVLHEQLSSSSEAVKLSPLPVVLVKCPGSWGTGVLVDQEEGLVLTCGHVVKGQKNVQVRVDHLKSHWYNGDVIYATPAGLPFDLGVIHLASYIPDKMWPNQIRIAESVQEGDRCFVIGHALFGQHYKLPASITSGNICKIITFNSEHVLTQSTCAVNAGASGGPLVGEDGQVYGIVTCNAKDTYSGASFPNVNLVIPLNTVWPAIKDYLKCKDTRVLDALCIRNKKVQALWSMQESQKHPIAVKSRL